MSLTPDQKVDIIIAYQNDLIPMIELATRYGKTRCGSYRLLKMAGIDTSKARRIEVTCNWCESLFLKRPCEARNHTYHYCNSDCYLNYVKKLGQPYKPNNSQGNGREA